MIDRFVASVKKQALKQELEIWKTCIYHCETNSFPTHGDLSVKIDGIIKKCGFVIITNEVNFWKICITWETIPSKWLVQDIINLWVEKKSIQDKLMDFNVSENGGHWYGFTFHIITF